jgi:hypothetical protein
MEYSPVRFVFELRPGIPGIDQHGHICDALGQTIHLLHL